MTWHWYILLLISIFDYTLASCNLASTDIWIKRLYKNHSVTYLTITCQNTSAEDYTYEIFQLNHNPKTSDWLIQLEIMNSDFSVIEDLTNPLTILNEYEKSNSFGLKINFCQVETILRNAFNNFPNITDLDLGFNKIKNLEFLFDIPKSVSNLNLTNNKITHFNFIALSDLSLWSLDLSYNRINTIEMPSHSVILNELNLANNPLKHITNCQQTANKYLDIYLLNLSSSLLNLPLRNITRCQLVFSKLISSNNKLTFDSLDLNFSATQFLDFSNSSITHLPINLFNDYRLEFLNLSHNDLNNLNSPVFSGVFGLNLDLSYCNIKDIDNVFQDISATNINLKSNNISELNSNSFSMLRSVDSIDLSFNNLKLNNDSFLNCKNLNLLNLANSNVSVLEQLTFNGLEDLYILHLENNCLKTLNSKIFKPLINIKEIYLQNNLLRTLESELFSFTLLDIINLNGNMIELIKTRAFYNLNLLELLQINNNNANLTIENQAFSHLRSLYNVDLSNSRLTNFNPNIFSETPNLETINITGNKFTLIDFRKPSALGSLKELHLTINGDLKPKTFLGLNFLLNLTIWDSKINTLSSRAFQGLFNLQALYLKNSVVNNIETGALDGLFRLTFLDIENIFKKGGSLNEIMFHDLKSLPTFNLSDQGLELISPFAFKGLTNLRNLFLTNNNLSSLEDNTFFDLKSLTCLDLSYNKITFLGRNYFIGLDELQTLNVSKNKLGVLELGAFQHFPFLENLILKKNNLTDFSVGIFSNLYHLKTLDLSQNSISTILFESFLPLHSLRYLNLDFNNLKTFGRYSLIGKLSNLRIGIAKNKWQCDYLRKMLVEFRNNYIDYSSSNNNFYGDNIEGIDCIDVCKYLLCLKDSHGIN